MSKQTLLRKLDHIWFRFEEAWLSFRNPMRVYTQHRLGEQAGKAIAFAQVRQQFDTFDPYNIDNQHFQMGFYYAKEQAKKVMQDDEDNGMD